MIIKLSAFSGLSFGLCLLSGCVASNESPRQALYQDCIVVPRGLVLDKYSTLPECWVFNAQRPKLTAATDFSAGRGSGRATNGSTGNGKGANNSGGTPSGRSPGVASSGSSYAGDGVASAAEKKGEDSGASYAGDGVASAAEKKGEDSGASYASGDGSSAGQKNKDGSFQGSRAGRDGASTGDLNVNARDLM